MRAALVQNRADPISDRRVISSSTDRSSVRDVEEFINARIDHVVVSKIAICLSLAQIRRQELFKELGFTSFKQYLEARRVHLHYHTAHEYAKIGEILLKYQDELDEVNFTDESGLKKLLLLDVALQRNDVHRSVVFRKLSENSFREFKDFATDALQSARADCEHELERDGTAYFEGTEECIVVRPSGKEIIWFDTDLEGYFPSSGAARDFRRHVLRAVSDFFTKNNDR